MFLNKILKQYRGSYMSAHVLLNLLNELRKRDKVHKFQMPYSHLTYPFNASENVVCCK